MEDKQDKNLDLDNDKEVQSRFLPIGNLSQTRKMTYDDILLMADMLTPYKEMILLLLDVFKSEEELIKFLDLFAGTTIKLPSRSRIYHVMENISVYRYWQAHLEDEDPEKSTAKHFNITRQYVTSIIDRVNNRDRHSANLDNITKINRT